jgi:hypothetical protein
MTENLKIKALPGAPELDAYVQDLKEVVRKHYPILSSEALLAGAAHVTGCLTTLQLPYMSNEMILEVITRNIDDGNLSATNAAKAAAELLQAEPEGSA